MLLILSFYVVFIYAEYLCAFVSLQTLSPVWGDRDVPRIRPFISDPV